MPLVELHEKEAGVACIVLSDPPTRNAMSEAMGAEFHSIVQSLKARADLRVLILTGAGDAFSSGGHLEMLEEKAKFSQEKNFELMQKFYSDFLSIYNLSIPTIAAINGSAAGAGLCLALACDLRISAAEASFALHFVQLGLHPGMGVTYFLPRLVGVSKAAELLFAGRRFKADLGLEMGLLNEVVPRVQLETRVLAVAQEIGAAGPQAVRNLKASLKQSPVRSLEECLHHEALAQAADYVGPQFAEGIRAAREKRKARFS